MVVIFTRQLATLLASGVPLVKGLEALTVQPENPHFGEIVEDCTLLVSSGSRLSAALATYPKIFPSVFVSMCQIGEETGQLDSVLSQLATWMEKDIAVRQRVKSALSYPTLVLCVSFGLGLLVFYKVMPGFISVFKDMNVPLPFITKLVMAVSTSMQSWLFWVLLVAGLFVGQRLLAQVMDSLEGRARLFAVMSRLPILGQMLLSASMARYCATVKVMLSSGMKYLHVFHLSAKTCGNPLIEKDANTLVKAIKDGDLVSDYMSKHTRIYGSTIFQLLRAGEESSRVPEMMGQAANYYDLDMNVRIDGLSAALEPILLAGVGLMVGTIVISVFLPMYAYIGKLGV
jgi:type IV pilus assembly protein PilC